MHFRHFLTSVTNICKKSLRLFNSCDTINYRLKFCCMDVRITIPGRGKGMLLSVSISDRTRRPKPHSHPYQKKTSFRRISGCMPLQKEAVLTRNLAQASATCKCPFPYACM